MAKRKTAETEAPATTEYTVLARRYRPQQFSDLVGQEPIARALSNAITSNRVAHAYLFTGTRGVGKTTTARILAKALNCEKGPTPTPCDRCESCLAIAAGQDVDVIEIDGASNRGIDNIRDLRANVQFRPTRSRYKIYIIDEVHQITKDAFNALLKTLEEPPPHVKFIFATTDVQKVPITILSRCQRFDFTGITGERIFDRLKEIVASEKRDADPDALRLIARRAAGSMRDAQSLLDQLLAFAGERITVEQVHQMLGTAADDQVVALADAVLAKDLTRALNIVKSGVAGGLQPSELIDQLIAYWRGLMIASCTDGSGLESDWSAAQLADIRRHARQTTIDTVLSGLDILQTAKYRVRSTAQPLVVVEMAIVRLSRLDELLSIGSLLSGDALPASRSAQGVSPAAVAPKSSAIPSDPSDGVKKKPAADSPADVQGPAKPLTSETLASVWLEVQSQIGGILAKELERAGLPAIFAPNTLVLSFPAVYNRQREYCADPNRLERVRDTVRRVTGSDWKLRVEVAAAGDGQNGPLPEAPPPRKIQHPLLQQAELVLGAKLVQIDERFGETIAAGDDPASENEDE